ncbi:DinB family protein [Paenibacillus spongiae]|uniref:DinB family protein n=1 Tax=Paenibacillus spongiae TaxID=2909671 RepID=A0ABY5S642_9BACL|nr:DinB family protein [Paenibacillus spongiae]UVI28020.1 DinB family protein [Paenibacillus spongiae]
MTDKDRIYLIADITGYPPQISRLLSMMNYARHTTLQAVHGLKAEQLDALIDEDSNSIGALLLHMAAVETAYQAQTFEDRELTEDEMAEWGPALQLGEEGRRAIRGHDLDYYLQRLSDVRNRTLDLFRTVPDEWLEQEEDFWYNKPANYYFMWYHVFEDEINHRGQIRFIRKRIHSAE